MRTLPLCVALLAAILPPPALAQPAPEYRLKEAVPRTGSSIRRDITSPLDVAINRSYADLNDEEKRKVRAHYVDMPERDEPPYPKAGLQALLKPIAAGQQRLLVQGQLSLIGLVDETGKVVEVRMLGSPSSQMTDFAGKIMLLTEFKPGVCSGQPCAMEFPLHLRFSVR
jgi:hypothetical protein